jgi:hypothetical protein
MSDYSSFGLKHKVAAVIGASHGIGRAIASAVDHRDRISQKGCWNQPEDLL